MSVLIIIAKIFLTVLLSGFLISGLFNLVKPGNPDLNPVIQRITGILVISMGLAGLYFTWVVWV